MHNFVISGKFLGQVASAHKLKESDDRAGMIWPIQYALPCSESQGTSVG